MKPVPRMTVTIFLSVTFLLVAAAAARAQDIGSFFVGLNYGINDNELENNFTTYRIDDVGISAGFILPIVVRK